MIIAGVMSGSSLDGLDVALVRFDDSNQDWLLLETYARDYTEAWVDRLRNYYELSAPAYVRLKYDYSHLIGDMLQQVLGRSSYEVDYISFHGHTLMHHPELGFTEQIGNGGIIAGITNVPTLVDFRNQDIALGGVGTPLAPLADVELFKGYDYYINLGGIANVTAVDGDQIAAYDLCPCNQVLNHYSLLLGHPYDDGGQMARSGEFIQPVADYFQSFDFWSRPAPKSLDNNWIRTELIPDIPAGSARDILHTYVVWMADCIARQLDIDRSCTMLVTGGGAHNTFFMEQLRLRLAPQGCKIDAVGGDIIDYKEAILMALLAKKYLSDQSNVLSQVTGASRNSIGGALYKI